MSKPPNAAKAPAPWLAKLRPAVEAIELPLEDFPASNAPPWTGKALELIAHPVVPGVFFDPDPPSTADLAKILGCMEALTAIITGEVPLSPQLEAKLTSDLNAHCKNLPEHLQPTVREIQRSYRRWCRTRSQIRRLARKAVAAAQSQPLPEAQIFLQAYSEGLASITPEQLFGDTQFSRNHRLLFILQHFWPIVPKFRSVGEMHRQLTKALGEPKVGDLKNFQKLTSQIGLRLRGRGRPRKQK